jgi:transposase InsO family protein
MRAGLRLGEDGTRKTRPPPARPPTRPEEPPATVAACWFVLANLTRRVGERSVRRAAARVAVLDANILRGI